MSNSIAEGLKDKPERIFDLKDLSRYQSYFNDEVKILLDPFVKRFSVLDEIYVDGLSASQIYGQSKIVLDSINEYLLFDEIPRIRSELAAPEESKNIFSTSNSDEEGIEDGASLEEELNPSIQSSETDSALEDFDAESPLIEGSEDFERENDGESIRVENEESDVEDIQEKSKEKVSALNDDFFDIEDFKKQVASLDNEENNSDSEIDYFQDAEEGSDDDEIAYFDDFFDKPNTSVKPKKISAERVVEEEDLSEIDDDEYEDALDFAKKDLFADDELETPNNARVLSTFEKQQEKIRDEIQNLETELVAEKKWTMKGEVSLKDRPEGALVDDPESLNLDFDRNSKPVPVITDEVTVSIEDLIKRRIKDSNFDEVQRRLLNDIGSFKKRERVEVSEEKSKQSLSEIYENEANNSEPVDEISDEMQKRHDEITDLFASISGKLDALASAHFVVNPYKPKSVEIKVSEIPRVTMEDAQPSHISSEAALAPQEIFRIGDDSKNNKIKDEVHLKSGLSFSKNELSREEKTRLRRMSKRKRSKSLKSKDSPLNKPQNSKLQSKRQKTGEVLNTLMKSKNISIVDKKGELTDLKGNSRNFGQLSKSSNLKL